MNRYQELRDQIAKSKAAPAKPKMAAKPAVVDRPKGKEIKAVRKLVEEQPSGQPAAAVQEELILGDEQRAAAVQEELILGDEQPSMTAAIETLAQAVEEIKRCIHAEIKSLKEEIQNLRMGK
jgi:hypothetical protein